MKWKIVAHEEEKYVEVITSGVADGDNTRSMARAIAQAMKTQRVNRALIDHRNIESVTGSNMDVYHRPKVFRLLGVIWGIKIAEIIKPEYEEHFRFFEGVCRNLGYQLSVFNEKDEALAWLLA